MPRLLLLTASELGRDPRARRGAELALARGLDVVAVSGRASGQPPVPVEGVRVVRVGRHGRMHRPHDLHGAQHRSSWIVRELRGVYRLARLAARTLALVRGADATGDADIVHAHDLDTLLAGWFVARRRSARLVYDAHELYAEFEADPPRLYRAATTALERALARRAAAVVTVSEPLADELRRRLRLRTQPLVVLNAPNVVEAAVEAHEGLLRVVYTGVFGSGRRVDDLLSALRAARGTHLTIYALQQDPVDLRSAASRYGVADRISIAKALPPERIVSALAAFDVGVVFDSPVTRNAELSLPNKLFEYLMAGLAVVAPRLPALSQLVERERVGLLFEPGRPDDLARGLEALDADRDSLMELRQRARGAAVERLNAEAQVTALLAAWDLH